MARKQIKFYSKLIQKRFLIGGVFCFKLVDLSIYISKKTNMKFFTLPLFLISTSFYAQIKMEKITAKNGNHYITTEIGYPTSGTYLYDGITDPTVELKADGSGVFQHKNLTKDAIQWGIECDAAGEALFEEGFNSAAYIFWYKLNSADSNWISSQFSIHFDKKKMYILGERCKEYNEEVK